MDHAQLEQSREVWMALLISGSPSTYTDWEQWADKQIKLLDNPPFWLIELSLAKTHSEALLSVSNGGCDDALIIGYIVGRHLAGEITFNIAWSKLDSSVDIASFFDTGSYKKHFGNLPIPLYCASKKEEWAINCLVPVAKFAQEQARSLLSLVPNNSCKPNPLREA